VASLTACPCIPGADDGTVSNRKERKRKKDKNRNSAKIEKMKNPNRQAKNHSFKVRSIIAQQ
jgi:hypothetical protein